MDKVDDFLNLARNIGFSHVAELNMNALVPLKEVRDMCASGRCSAYGHLWSCPPACGSIEHTSKRMNSYTRGIIVQTTGVMEDEFDLGAIRSSEMLHKRNFETLSRESRIIEQDCLPLTAGGCTICIKCTYPDKPCRFPKRMLSSMEAYGLLVSDVCLKSGLHYKYGDRTITYTSCILYK